jgi:hypothetical protein
MANVIVQYFGRTQNKSPNAMEPATMTTITRIARALIHALNTHYHVNSTGGARCRRLPIRLVLVIDPLTLQLATPGAGLPAATLAVRETLLRNRSRANDQ